MSQTDIELDYTDIVDIFKNNLKIENSLKSITSIFNNERFSSKIDFAPYFQRNYVWDESKATYFIESIILGTEIPPIVLFNNQKNNEVIDGRQRYETIVKFLNDKLVLKEEGLKSLKSLFGKRFSELPEELKERFEETKLRILQCSVVNEPSLEEEKEDKIKKEIFRRYNSGITPLKKEEIQRAEFILDNTTKAFSEYLLKNKELYMNFSDIFLSKRQIKAQDRDKLNFLLSKLRVLITLPLIPINNYANSSSKSDVIGIYYKTKIANIDTKEEIEEFAAVMKKLTSIRETLLSLNSKFRENGLMYECCYWILSVMYKYHSDIFYTVNVEEFCEDISKAENIEEFWYNIESTSNDVEEIFKSTGSHYYKSIVHRYTLIANYFAYKYTINIDKYLRNSAEFKDTVNSSEKQIKEVEQFRLNKTDPTSVTIEDILKKINKSRFLIRPDYQRSEVTNPKKSSYLMESIMLGIKIPPIFLYKRLDKVSEVVDGQQRLLSIIGFLGESYKNEYGEKEFSKKNMYKLSGLRILNKLNKCDSDSIENIDVIYKERILDFQLDVVEIDAEQNPAFDSIDLFLRLNTKPYPIKANSFEMWNAYVNKDIILAIRKISDDYSGKIFRAKDTRMRNEELITSLAYMDYKRKTTNTIIRNELDIYIRSGRINARIKRKADITKVLSDVTNKETNMFAESVEKVLDFIEKINVLTQDNDTLLNTIFAHKSKYNQSRTNQNFYLLWVFFDSLNINDIKQSRECIVERLSELYKLVQKVPKNYNIDIFFTEIDNFKL
ncbi:DUF262 domain-containing protein [Clostridium tagluense]|uniref:DUF262 domain-containing protein n=1 Tax=Clostridium tagluense TaxID=360422 RepID=UPI001C6DFBE5|nr:DUF262 domain-containing protein [Clostridium tagluense]MBW9158728.1 DUF262 domain-containing protein [Clostridium tagluense]WLC67400.1 DUF262 domain-containing protein [Clostridium tagluense]